MVVLPSTWMHQGCHLVCSFEKARMGTWMIYLSFCNPVLEYYPSNISINIQHHVAWGSVQLWKMEIIVQSSRWLNTLPRTMIEWIIIDWIMISWNAYTAERGGEHGGPWYVITRFLRSQPCLLEVKIGIPFEDDDYSIIPQRSCADRVLEAQCKQTPCSWKHYQSLKLKGMMNGRSVACFTVTEIVHRQYLFLRRCWYGSSLGKWVLWMKMSIITLLNWFPMEVLMILEDIILYSESRWCPT